MQYDLAALLALVAAWAVIPALALNDRISFNGERLARRGLLASLQRIITGRAREIKVDDIERVETFAVRVLRRGGRVRYRYRTEISGKGISLVLGSGGKSYRAIVRALFTLLPDEKLDARSHELRDYLTDSEELRLTVKLLKLAPANVLDEAVSELQQEDGKRIRRQRRAHKEMKLLPSDLERGRLLRRAASQLRAAGRLREAAEAFRRALLVAPGDGWLIYEFSRFLRSQASVLRDVRLLMRSRAALRLAARRCGEAASLLWRIGESHVEYGDLEQARRSFRRALELNPRSFRAETGLAELGLRQGKLAHVIHHYEAATRIAPDGALARFARREAAYYTQLNTDDQYLALELRRIGLLYNTERARLLASRVTFASLLLFLVGGLIDDSLTDVGLAIASSSILAWISVALLGRFLNRRRKPRPVE
jgi:tetratricopeptide (TPR) repeat protein